MSEKVDPYLELSNNPVRFEAVNQVTNVFFDDSNKQAINAKEVDATKDEQARFYECSSNIKCSSETTVYFSADNTHRKVKEKPHIKMSLRAFLTSEDTNNSNDFEAEKSERTSIYVTAEDNQNINHLEKKTKKMIGKCKSNFDIYNIEDLEKRNMKLKNIYENFIYTTPIEICNETQFNESEELSFIDNTVVQGSICAQNMNNNFEVHNLDVAKKNMPLSITNKYEGCNEIPSNTQLSNPFVFTNRREKKSIKNSGGNSLYDYNMVNVVAQEQVDRIKSKHYMKDNSVPLVNNRKFTKQKLGKIEKFIATYSNNNYVYESTETIKENTDTEVTKVINPPLEKKEIAHSQQLDQSWLKKSDKIRFKCSFCNKIFSVRREFNYHLFLHEKEIYQCNMCPKKYRRKCHLTQHIYRCHI